MKSIIIGIVCFNLVVGLGLIYGINTHIKPALENRAQVTDYLY